MPGIELEKELPEILSLLAALLEAARARLYRMDTRGCYRLAASTGFAARSGPEDAVAPEPLVEWVRYHRKGVYANSPQEAGSLAPVMERDQYAKVLAVPVYVGPRLAAIIELQDKPHGGLFSDRDLLTAEGALARLRALLAEGGVAAVTLPEPIPPEDAERLFLEPRPAERAFPPPPPLFHFLVESEETVAASHPPLPNLLPGGDGSPPPPTALAVAEATAGGSPAAEPRRVGPLAGEGSVPSGELTRRERLVLRGFGNALLLNAGCEAVVFSLWTPERSEIQIASRRPLSEGARERLTGDLEKTLGMASPGLRPGEKLVRTDYPFGRAEGEAGGFAGAQTSVIDASPERALLFTVLFGRTPSPEEAGALRETHRLVRSAVSDARAADRYQAAYRSFVNEFLEPGLKPYPQLKAHSLAVGMLCRRFAEALRFSPEEAEQVTVAGLLHDIGLRELELPYERISGRRPLDLQEIAVVRNHPVLGEAVLKRIHFPYPVAPLVRHHHERFDGSGYPDGLTGEKIPFGARMIAIAEAYDALTAEHSYRAPIPRENALQTILGKGGTQFDPDLALSFCGLIRAS